MVLATTPKAIAITDLVRRREMTALAIIAALLASEVASGQTARHGGMTGADLTLEAIEPDAEPLQVGAAGDDPADIARYLLASGPRDIEISPDGETIAMTWSITGLPQLWIVPAVGGQPRQLTFGNGVTFFRWLADGTGFIYGADNDGNEQPAYYFISASGVEERLVLPAAAGGFRSFGDTSLDASTFVYASTERTGLDFDIYRSNLSGESELIFEGTYSFVARSLSPDASKAVVTEAVGEDSDNLYLLDLDSGELEVLSRPEPRASHGGGGFAWEPDGAAFYFATNEGREFAALARYDIERHESTILEDTLQDVEDVVLCGEQSRYLVWTTNNDGFDDLHIRDRGAGLDLTAPTLPEGDYKLSCSRSSARLAILVNGWRTPGDVLVLDLESGAKWTGFASSYAGLDAARLVRPRSIRMRARDGVELQGLLYLPDAGSRRGAGPPPVLFDVHGGPTAQARPDFDAVAQYHVDRGLAVFSPNVRGSTGFGRTYATLDDRERRLDSVRDLVDMLEYLGSEGLVDATRAAVMGGSYGGYMVNAVLSNYPGTFRAGVALYGVADWVTALEIASPSLKASDRIEYGDIREQRWRDFYTENSPIRQADSIDVPVLYSHGIMDPRIDISETETMVRTLRANGIDAPFIRIPDEGHGWRKLDNRLFYYRRQADFLESHLGLGD